MVITSLVVIGVKELHNVLKAQNLASFVLFVLNVTKDCSTFLQEHSKTALLQHKTNMD